MLGDRPKFDIQIIIGSQSDMKMVEESGMMDVLNKVGLRYQVSVLSAHRHSLELTKFCREIIESGDVTVFIAVAGMSAALPGAIAGITESCTPVIGVALDCGFQGGLDALMAITRMPTGVPVLCTGIGKPGLKNAAIAAYQICSIGEPEVAISLEGFISSEKNTKPPIFGIVSV